MNTKTIVDTIRISFTMIYTQGEILNCIFCGNIMKYIIFCGIKKISGHIICRSLKQKCIWTKRFFGEICLPKNSEKNYNGENKRKVKGTRTTEGHTHKPPIKNWLRGSNSTSYKRKLWVRISPGNFRDRGRGPQYWM